MANKKKTKKSVSTQKPRTISKQVDSSIWDVVTDYAKTVVSYVEAPVKTCVLAASVAVGFVLGKHCADKLIK